MSSATNKQLVQVGVNLQALWSGTIEAITLNVLRVAIAEIVPDMAPRTVAWIIPMLRDKSYAADCRGETDLAATLFSAADTLEWVYFEISGNTRGV